MISYRFCCSIKEIHQFTGKQSNLCQAPEINYFYKKKCFLNQKNFLNKSPEFSQIIAKIQINW